MTTLGKVHVVTRELDWRINEFFSLSEEDGKWYDSPFFLLAGEYWYFCIYPNGYSKSDSVGYISLYLHRKQSDPPICITYSFGLKTLDGDIYTEAKFCRLTFDENRTSFGRHKFLKRSKLSENKSELVPCGILTIFCTIQYSESTDDANISDDESSSSNNEISEDDTGEKGKTNNEDEMINRETKNEKKCVLSEDKGVSPIGECSYCKRPFIAENVSFREEKDLELRCTRSVTEKILDDLGKILESKEYSDVIIKVKDKEFHLHRNILAGRNSYFHSMFNSEMKEKTSGIVSINDCEPSVFESFIHFLYTGKITALTSDNVCALFETTDKYQEDQLKSECLSYMKNEISVENFCDFIVLALRHDEKELLQCATDLFCRKTLDIILSVKWQTFMKEYPTQANELHIKALRFNAK